MRYLILLLFLTAWGFLPAQQLTSYNLSHLPQRGYMNPAFAPHGKIHVGIPVLSGISTSYSNSGFSYDDLFRRNNNNLLILDIENAIKKMDEHNYLTAHSETELLSFGARAGKNYFNLNVTEKADAGFSYSRSFFEFLYYGNAATAGTVQQLSPDLESIHYREYGFSWSRNFASFLTAGMRIKYLYGMEHLLTKGQGVSVFTDPNDFSLTASSEYTVYTSGIDTGSFSGFSFSNYAFGKKNTGYGIDLGFVATPVEFIEISVSVVDIGKIKWTTGNAIHHTASGDENFVFNGINLNEFINNDSLDAETYLEQIGDSLQNSFHVTTTHESYSYSLPKQFYFGLSYLLSENYRVTGLVRNKQMNHANQNDYHLSFTGKMRQWLNYSIAFNKLNSTPVTLGAGFTLNYRNTQLYFASDNVPGMINWKKSYSTGFRAGINMMFGVRPKANPAPQPELMEPEASIK